MKSQLLLSFTVAGLIGTTLALFIIGILTNNLPYIIPFIIVATIVIVIQRIHAYQIDRAKKEYYKKRGF